MGKSKTIFFSIGLLTLLGGLLLAQKPILAQQTGGSWNQDRYYLGVSFSVPSAKTSIDKISYSGGTYNIAVARQTMTWSDTTITNLTFQKPNIYKFLFGYRMGPVVLQMDINYYTTRVNFNQTYLISWFGEYGVLDAEVTDTCQWNLQSLSAVPTLKYRWDFFGRIRPYVGTAVALNFLQLSERVDEYQIIPVFDQHFFRTINTKETLIKPQVQLMAGVEFKMVGNLILFGQLDYIFDPEVNFSFNEEQVLLYQKENGRSYPAGNVPYPKREVYLTLNNLTYTVGIAIQSPTFISGE